MMHIDLLVIEEPVGAWGMLEWACMHASLHCGWTLLFTDVVLAS